MNIQENQLKPSYCAVKIPEIKRYSYPLIQNYESTFNNSLFSKIAFQPFKSQINDLKPQLSLRPDKSHFTLVTASQDDAIQACKVQSHQNATKIQNTQQYKVQLHKLFSFLISQNLESKKQQKQFGLNTKNILRNICNAQNQYILFDNEAQKIIKSSIQNIQKFKNWITKLRFHTFQEFQSAWSNTNRKRVYTKLYKKLCRKFYVQNAIPYIINSRIRNKQTKLSHIRFIYRFLQGIQKPQNFFYFKLKEKQKGKHQCSK